MRYKNNELVIKESHTRNERREAYEQRARGAGMRTETDGRRTQRHETRGVRMRRLPILERTRRRTRGEERRERR